MSNKLKKPGKGKHYAHLQCNQDGELEMVCHETGIALWSLANSALGAAGEGIMHRFHGTRDYESFYSCIPSLSMYRNPITL